MTWTSLDRWTCPTCGSTEAPDVPEDELAAAIRAVQQEHAAAHPAPRKLPPTSPSKMRRRRAGSRS
ncbi:hypothetical protein [Blastococcus sp. CT_GayMR16]|uniref:hypothetical protein n=1 Tax=Blastococcus sp. CT_GayMR16 TaxID=2559607 RepID=UPI0010730943|nr:hypothetical protein [Blastococcus sp. CT_GayMR16]TFV90420.1 hypothetical protein E4P38_02985 [Blastococcus sp. CT_GayMR16]